MRDVGNAQAQGVAARGRLWGGAVANMGDLASQAYQAQQADKIRKQEAAFRQQQLAEIQQRMTLAGQQAKTAQEAAAWRRAQDVHGRVVSSLTGVIGAPKEQQPALYQQMWNGLVGEGLIDPKNPKDLSFAPAEYPGEEWARASLRSILDPKELDEALRPQRFNMALGGKVVEAGPNGATRTIADNPMPTKAPVAARRSFERVIMRRPNGTVTPVSFERGTGEYFDPRDTETPIDITGWEAVTGRAPARAATPRDNPRMPQGVADYLLTLKQRGLSRGEVEGQVFAGETWNALRRDHPNVSSLDVQQAINRLFPANGLGGTFGGGGGAPGRAGGPGTAGRTAGPGPNQPAGAGRTATSAEVRAAAQGLGISEAQMRQELQARGVRLVD